MAWVLVGLPLGCWRENPAFLAVLPDASTGSASSSGAPPGESSGDTNMTPETGSSGGSSGGTDATGAPGTTAVEPGTTGEPMTGTTTTDAPESTSGTTGAIDEKQLCAEALFGLHDVQVLRDIADSTCDASWSSSDAAQPGVIKNLVCPSASTDGIIKSLGAIMISPDDVFPAAMVTGPRKSLTGTIEGTFPPTSLAGAEHPCLLAWLGCPLDFKASCSLNVQISVKPSSEPEFGLPLPDIHVNTGGPVAVAIPLSEFKGQDVDLLLVVFNDEVGSGAQEAVAWGVPAIVDVKP